MNLETGLYQESKQRETMEPQNTMQKRQVAKKIAIKSLLNGQYVKEEGWEPNYVSTELGKVSRVNIIGTVVMVEQGQTNSYATIDDGTGQIQIRSFEDNPELNGLQVGNTVLIIGRPREFNTIYIIPEIIKHIEDMAWVNVRKLELGLSHTITQIQPTPKPTTIEIEDPYEFVLEIIRELDTGMGADFQTVVNRVNDEALVEEMIKSGDLFEIKPGKLKILE